MTIRTQNAPARKPFTRSDNAVFDELLADISPRMKSEEAALESNRCLYCYDAPCIAACPTHIDIPRFIKQIGSKNTVGAAKTILEANALGHSCARVCPVEVLCEGSCVYLDWHGKSIQIARLQRYATDHLFYDSGRRPFKPGPDNGQRVAVIGAGPAGLSCAFYLRRLGHPVTIFERSRIGGGLNAFGIADYKMTQKIALDEVKNILDLGAELRCEVEVGKDVPLEKLEREFSAVFIGIGLGSTKPLGVPGEDLSGVMDALSFISDIKNRRSAALKPSSTTVVIGAGNTAIDAVTQAKRLGAARVIMAYRRGRADISAYDYEFELAQKDQIEFLWHSAPKRILGKGKVSSVEFARTRFNGRDLEEVRGSEFTVPCDRVIVAIGQSKQLALAKAAGLALGPDGRIQVDPKTLRASRAEPCRTKAPLDRSCALVRTSSALYWAGGDAVNGGKEVVNAAADGKRAAWHIHKALTKTAAPAPGHAYWVGTIEGRGRP